MDSIKHIKYFFVKGLFIIGLLIVVGCKKDDPEPSTPTDDTSTTDTTNTAPDIQKTYFISAKFDDEWQFTETNGTNFYSSNYDIGWEHTPDPFNTENMIALYINDTSDVLMDSVYIQNLEGQTISFDEKEGVYAHLEWEDKDPFLYSKYSDQGSLTIDEVTYGGRYFQDYPYFTIGGHFNVEVAEDSQASTVEVTEGSFNVTIVAQI